MASSDSGSVSSVTPAAAQSNSSLSLVASKYPLFHSSSQTSSVKLNRDNYLVWEAIVLPFIEGNLLDSHLKADTSPPPLIARDSQLVPNPAYAEWMSADKQLVGWLRNTMTPELSLNLLHCRTAHLLLEGARALTCGSLKSRVLVLKGEFQKARKNALSMTEYLNKMRTISDQLALAGAPVSITDLVLQVLNGLDSEYNGVVSLVAKMADDPNLSWTEVQSTLLSFESRLDQLNHFSSLTLQPSANFVQGNRAFRPSFPANNQFSGRGAWRGSKGFSGGRRSRGRRFDNSSGSRPYCHLCERPDHVVANCFMRFDRTFQPPTHQRFGDSSAQHPHALYA